MHGTRRILAIATFLVMVGAACSSSAAVEEAADAAASSTTSTIVAPRSTNAPHEPSEPSVPSAIAMAEDELTLEDAMTEAIEEGNNELSEFGNRELDATLPRDERVRALLNVVGDRTLNETDLGQCLIREFEGFDEATLQEIENFDEVPSPATITLVGEVNRSCGNVRQSVANTVGGMQNSGGSDSWLDTDCLEASFSEDGAGLYALTGNAQALDLPDFIDRDNSVSATLVPLSRCMNYGEVVNSGYPGSLDRSSIDCVTDWGHTEQNLIRLLSGNMNGQEFDTALVTCLTANEYAAFGAAANN